MRQNKIKQMWKAGKCPTLGWISLSHGLSAEVMARQGFDALCVDLQHGTAEMKDVAPLLQAISQTETVPVVRVAWNDPAAIMKALDLGAYGIIVPLVNNAKEAAMAVAACRYPPVGMRSNGPVRAVHYGGADYVANANDEVVVMAMIETKEGLANLDAICATPGLDAVYIGPADLSFALGLAPRGDNPDPLHMATCDKILAAAHKAGIKCVMHCASAAFAAGAGRRQPHDGAHGRGLADAVSAQQADAFALVHFQRDAEQHAAQAIGRVHVLQRQQGSHACWPR